MGTLVGTLVGTFRGTFRGTFMGKFLGNKDWNNVGLHLTVRIVLLEGLVYWCRSLRQGR